MIEEWKDVVGYEGLYQVSNLSNVRNRFNKVLKPCYAQGYARVSLSKKESKIKQALVHRLVAEVFIENSDNKRTVNHINGIKSDNRLENLEWCTYSENNKHALDNRLRKTNAKIVLQYTKSGEFIKEWNSTLEIERVLGIDRTNISCACNGRHGYKSAGGFKWKYKN